MAGTSPGIGWPEPERVALPVVRGRLGELGWPDRATSPGGRSRRAAGIDLVGDAESAPGLPGDRAVSDEIGPGVQDMMARERRTRRSYTENREKPAIETLNVVSDDFSSAARPEGVEQGGQAGEVKRGWRVG